jgi:ketosteroid isomerase-like protein
MKKKLIIGTFILSFFLTGCSASKNQESSSSMKEEHIHYAENGDLRETTKSADDLPQFLKDKPEEMVKIYAAAAKHRDLLEKIPCYCGCADSGGHRDNYDCFVHDNKENGEVVWDDHGTRCGVCLETATQSILQFKDGKSIKEIREYIDSKYKEGFAKPTPTPMPKG